VARHSETDEELVVYRQEYGDHSLWVRPAQMFVETVLVDGQDVPRFRLVEDRRSQISIATGRRGFLEENLIGCPKAEARAGAVV